VIDKLRFPDGTYVDVVIVGDGWAVETFPATEGGYWALIRRFERPAHGFPRRQAAQQAMIASAFKLIKQSSKQEQT
jgi:hypothetical protein